MVSLEKKKRQTDKERDRHRKRRNRVSTLGTIEQTMDHGVRRLFALDNACLTMVRFFLYLHGWPNKKKKKRFMQLKGITHTHSHTHKKKVQESRITMM